MKRIVVAEGILGQCFMADLEEGWIRIDIDKITVTSPGIKNIGKKVKLILEVQDD